MSGTRSDVRSDVRADARADEGVGGIDADAAAYLALLSAQGVAVTGAQSSAIDAFYVTGKDEGWYSTLKRIFLPIWGAAAPNAICMVSGSSGTYSGTVTHASGYVQSNGSTGYFDLGTSASALSITTTGGGLFALVYDASTQNHCHIGTHQSSSQYFSIMSDATGPRYRTVPFTTIRQQLVNESYANMEGVFLLVRDGGDDVYYSRKAAGIAELDRATQAVSGSVTSINHYAMALNSLSTPAQFSNAKYGSWGMTEGAIAASGFTSALQTLWETTTGLSLP